MNAIEQYLQAQSRIEMLTRYYSYREDQAHANGTASFVLLTAWVQVHSMQEMETSRRSTWLSKRT